MPAGPSILAFRFSDGTVATSQQLAASLSDDEQNIREIGQRDKGETQISENFPFVNGFRPPHQFKTLLGNLPNIRRIDEIRCQNPTQEGCADQAQVTNLDYIKIVGLFRTHFSED